jgi:cytochrome b
MAQGSLQTPATLVWDLPLRIWHWAFALCISGSLYSGLSGDIGLIERHQQLGYVMLGLLLFRLGWGVWGGRYARLGHYRISPAGIVGHFRGVRVAAAHTAPGVAIAVMFVLLVSVQVATGLFATDDIFTEGPLTGYVDNATASAMTWIHHRVFWLIVAAISVHLIAHAVYALRGDSTPLAMFTGRKSLRSDSVAGASVAGRHAVAVLTAVVAGAAVWAFLALV